MSEDELVKRAVKSKPGWDWPDTVHSVTIEHTYGPHGTIEHVKSKCGRRGRGESAYQDAPLCKRCFPNGA